MRWLRNSYRHMKRALNALRGQDVWQGVQVDCDRVCLGDEGARWCICPTDLTSASVIYSFGVGEDISFELEIIRRFGLRVNAFDPTPRSIEWLRKQTVPKDLVFHAYGIADFDGTCKFVPPANPAHVSYTMLARRTDLPAVEAPVYRLASIAKTLDHHRIDLLKMDIEGAEYNVLADLLSSQIAVKQLLVEFHHRWPEVGIERTRRAIQSLNEAGYRIFSISPSGEEYSFRM
jgi:FkbM family methyltransferase